MNLDKYIIFIAETKSSHHIPKSYQKAMRLDSSCWRAAIDIEYKMHMSKNMWDLVPEKLGMNIIDCM